MKKQIDETSGRVGAAMRNARQTCVIMHQDAAALLHITPKELGAYECGAEKIPTDILERVFAMAYKMIQIRQIEDRYRRQRRVFWKLKQVIADAE